MKETINAAVEGAFSLDERSRFTEQQMCRMLEGKRDAETLLLEKNVDIDAYMASDEGKRVLSRYGINLERFLSAQDRFDTYQQALSEVKSGRKMSHWIWFILPQMKGLGYSETSRFYGINGRPEAIAYIHNNTLRNRLVEISTAILESDRTVYEIFAADAIKVQSCMKLFASVSDNPVFREVIKKHNWH